MPILASAHDHSAPLLTVDQITDRCRAAVRLAFRGDRYGTDAIEEAQDRLLMTVWEGIPRDFMYRDAAAPVRSSLTGPSVIYSKYSAKKSLDVLPLERRQIAFPAEHVPSFGKLHGQAKNLRRSHDRDAAHKLASMPVDLDETLRAPDEGNRAPHVTIEQAHRMAVDLVDEIGLLSLRAADLSIYALAYTAARYATLYALDTGQIGKAIAGELRLSYDNYVSYLKRAPARMIERTGLPTRPSWAEALHMPEGGIAQKPSRSRTMSADLDTEERDSQRGIEHPLRTRHADPVPATPPTWRETLSATQHARLSMAATLSVGKAEREAKQRAERAEIRQTAADAAREDR